MIELEKKRDFPNGNTEHLSPQNDGKDLKKIGIRMCT